MDAHILSLFCLSFFHFSSWFFIIPYASIVFGSLLLAVLAWPMGLVHQCWYIYTYYYRGGQEEDRIRVFHVADVRANEKEKKAYDVMGDESDAGSAASLLAKVTRDAENDATLAVDRPVLDEAARPIAKRRGAVTMNI